MNVLLDSCVWAGAAEAIRGAQHDVACVADRGPDPGDDEVLLLAATERRVLVTLDKDFGALAIRDGRRHCGIVRLVAVRAREQGPTVVAVIEMHGDALSRGAIVTVRAGQVRVRSVG